MTLPATLDGWLRHAEASHPEDIELGLERVAAVAARLGLAPGSGQVAATVITVAGTNGKGSCVHAMERLLCDRGVGVAAYTSPHLIRFNERARVNGAELDDIMLAAAMARVEAARGATPLTYFEFTTLAIFSCFSILRPQVALLEVGLGGRLDAVNIIDPTVAVITSIALDHQRWLGDDLDSIAAEKAGILRRGIPVVLASESMPAPIAQRVRQLDCAVFQLGREFTVAAPDDQWHQWQLTINVPGQSPLNCRLPMMGVLPENVAAAAQAVIAAGFVPDTQTLARSLSQLRVPGRFEYRRVGSVPVVLDVAHNPAGCARARHSLAAFRRRKGLSGRCIGVFAALADKDQVGMLHALAGEVAVCYVAHFDHPACPRCGDSLLMLRQGLGVPPPGLDTPPQPAMELRAGGGVAEAFAAALADCREGDFVYVFGSFHTVGALRPLTI